MSKVSIPSGTRDFGPVQMTKRNYIFDTIRSVFEVYGFAPIETPAMEKMSTLMGKYGEEGDRLIYKILNSANYLSKVRPGFFTESIDNDGLGGRKTIFKDSFKTSKELTPLISEKALRYDLTVPFARFVVQHRNELSFPFKRYQIQPVWRADRPQKGRYREFYQCDVDIIGTESLLNEVELVEIVQLVFNKLQLPDVVIKLNNRKILTGLAEVVGEADKIIDITVAIDKLDKIGLEGVNKEMLEKGVSQAAVDQLQPLINLEGSNEEKMTVLRDLLKTSETGLKGIEELEYIFAHCGELSIDNVEFDVTLARGLNYYTGAIFEVQHKDFRSSICGGGRYDNLTGVFDPKSSLSGVGVSFGADRIYDLLNDKDLFPEAVTKTTEVLFVNFGEAEAKYCLKAIRTLRDKGIRCELYPDSVKMKKQMKYANDKNIGHVVMVGSQEIESGILVVKNMMTGEQESMTLDQLLESLC